MIGMVYDPVTTAFAAEEPVTEPIKPLETTAIFAGPPRVPPAIAVEIFSIALPPPVA
jgi:hypothetical protein